MIEFGDRLTIAFEDCGCVGFRIEVGIERDRHVGRARRHERRRALGHLGDVRVEQFSRFAQAVACGRVVALDFECAALRFERRPALVDARAQLSAACLERGGRTIVRRTAHDFRKERDERRFARLRESRVLRERDHVGRDERTRAIPIREDVAESGRFAIGRFDEVARARAAALGEAVRGERSRRLGDQ